MSTKGLLVNAAFKELRISGLTVTPNPGQIVDAIIFMDLMVSEWGNHGLCLGYTQSVGDVIEPAQESGLDKSQEYAVISNLALDLAPLYGKAPHPQTVKKASIAYSGLFSVDIGQREPDSYQPTGSGHTYGYAYRDRFRYQASVKNAPSNCETLIIKTGQTKIFEIDLSEAVGSNTLVSYAQVTTGGLAIISGFETDGVFTMELQGSTIGYATLKTTLTLDTGEVDPITINFDVQSM